MTRKPSGRSGRKRPSGPAPAALVATTQGGNASSSIGGHDGEGPANHFPGHGPPDHGGSKAFTDGAGHSDSGSWQARFCRQILRYTSSLYASLIAFGFAFSYGEWALDFKGVARPWEHALFCCRVFLAGGALLFTVDDWLGSRRIIAKVVYVRHIPAWTIGRFYLDVIIACCGFFGIIAGASGWGIYALSLIGVLILGLLWLLLTRHELNRQVKGATVPEAEDLRSAARDLRVAIADHAGAIILWFGFVFGLSLKEGSAWLTQPLTLDNQRTLWWYGSYVLVFLAIHRVVVPICYRKGEERPTRAD